MSDVERYKEALRRGHLAVVKGRPREAIEHYREAGSLAGERPLPFVAMGNVLLQMRQPKEAAIAFDEALSRASGDIEALRGKAMALDAEGRRDEAAKLMRRATELEAMAQAGRATPRQTDEQREAIERRFREAMSAAREGDPGRAVVAYMAVAEGYASRNMFDAALDSCMRAVETIPAAIDVHLLMARLYLRRGWRELGVQRVLLLDRRLSIDADPRRRAALRALARDHHDLDPALERVAAG